MKKYNKVMSKMYHYNILEVRTDTFLNELVNISKVGGSIFELKLEKKIDSIREAIKYKIHNMEDI